MSASSITIPASSGTITINTNRASSSFTHTITLKVGNTTIATYTGVGASQEVNIADIDDAILATIPSASSATVDVSCQTFNGNTSIGTKSTSFTANVGSGAKPVFANYTYADTNSTTTAVTGNNQVMISGKSALSVTISSGNKAVAQYSATMAKYTFAISGISVEQAYSSSSITKAVGTPTVAPTELPSGTRDLVVSAIDSRGQNTAVTKQVTIVPYEAPIINATATRANGFENTTTISIAGSFSRIELGGTAKNTVNTSSGVQYRYKAQSSTTWGSWTNKTATVDTSTGKITVANFTLDLDNQQAYDIQIRITDKLETTTASLAVSIGQPAFFVSDDGRVSVGGMPTQSKKTGEAGLLQVMGRIFADNLYPVGSIYMTTTMTTASQVNAALGGTWEAWGAGRVPVGMGSNGTTDYQTVEATGGEDSHKLTVSEMPAHNHTFSFTANSGGVGTSATYGTVYSSGRQSIIRNSTIPTTGELKYWGIDNKGDDGSHENRQPYITVYMYKRTA